MHTRGDFAANGRLLVLSGISLIIGAVATGVAWVLLSLIRACTNLFFYGTLSTAFHSPAEHQLGLWVIL
ncbi:MAG TPA: chloride channel protein, partial [bacterium]